MAKILCTFLLIYMIVISIIINIVISIATLTISNVYISEIYAIMHHACKLFLSRHNAVIMIMCNLYNFIYFEIYTITCHDMYTL